MVEVGLWYSQHLIYRFDRGDGLCTVNGTLNRMTNLARNKEKL